MLGSVKAISNKGFMGRAPGRGQGEGAVFRQKEFSENERNLKLLLVL